MIAALERVNLLILDDWGPELLTADQRRDLLGAFRRGDDATAVYRKTTLLSDICSLT